MRSDRVPLPDGLTRNELLDAIEELKKGIPEGYGPSTFYDVLHEGKRYPPKPIVGIAATEKSGFNYIGDNFTGGLKSKCFKILIDNGFEIVEKSGESAVRKIKTAHETDNWSDEELQASIEAYLDMMTRLKEGKHFTKKEYYEELSERFGRTAKAFEFRMQNISAVLNELGRNWLEGLPLAKNVGTGSATLLPNLGNPPISNSLMASTLLHTCPLMDHVKASDPHRNRRERFNSRNDSSNPHSAVATTAPMSPRPRGFLP